MRRPRSGRKPKPSAKRFTLRARKRLGILLGAVAAVSILIVSLGGSTPLSAAGQSAPDQAKQKRYKATRAFVVDQQTGESRMPTQQELDEVVANLVALGQRPDETLTQSSAPNGAVKLDLEGAFNGVLLARPNGDGTFETKCVFTLEEGAEFLGIVEDTSAQ